MSARRSWLLVSRSEITINAKSDLQRSVFEPATAATGSLSGFRLFRNAELIPLKCYCLRLAAWRHRDLGRDQGAPTTDDCHALPPFARV